ncbi:MAG TPA: non-homologous end-joining DNA ligase [Acidimicrobiales bacterium]|nr:non-homologous end-joining DNA ligase [Acidimicrobiales bacterium]
MTNRVEVELAGRQVSLSNLDKVLWPRLGLTKGWMVDYYTSVAPVLVPHLRRHPVTLHRFPDGVDGVHWYETRAPAHPPWVDTVTFHVRTTGKVFDVCVLDDLPSLVWAAQIAAVELHPFLGTADDLERPRALVFDLDPGPPATIVDCCRVALRVRDLLDDLGLRAWVKTSGGVGLHVYVPLNTPVTYDQTKGFARAVALLLERERPESVTSAMSKARRPGKVFVDWSQNDFGKSTVAPYSLRGWEIPTVSTPVDWDEVGEGAESARAGRLMFLPDAALPRAETGDLFAPVLAVQQALPDGFAADAP